MSRLLTLRKGRDTDGTFWHSADVIIAIIERPPNGATLTEISARLDIIKKLRASQKEQGADPLSKAVLEEGEWQRIKDTYEANQFPQVRQFIIDIWKDIENAEQAAEPSRVPN